MLKDDEPERIPVVELYVGSKVAGVKTHAAPAGKPEQERLTYQ